MKKLFTLFAAILPIALIGQVQLERSVIGATGGSGSAGNIQLDYTAGESVVTTASSGDIILTQGFHQPTGSVVGIENPDYGISIQAYPNPTDNQVILDMETERPHDFYVEVFDISGKKVLSNDNFSAQSQYKHTVDMSSFAAGHYFIRLRTKEGGFQESLKVQKVN